MRFNYSAKIRHLELDATNVSNANLVAGMNVAAQYLISASTALTKGHHYTSKRVRDDIRCAIALIEKLGFLSH